MIGEFDETGGARVPAARPPGASASGGRAGSLSAISLVRRPGARARLRRAPHPRAKQAFS